MPSLNKWLHVIDKICQRVETEMILFHFYSLFSLSSYTLLENSPSQLSKPYNPLPLNASRDWISHTFANGYIFIA